MVQNKICGTYIIKGIRSGYYSDRNTNREKIPTPLSPCLYNLSNGLHYADFTSL